MIVETAPLRIPHRGADPGGPMDLIQLIYVSRPFGFDEAILSDVLLSARTHNRRDGITGALLCRRDVYLQLLEGPEAPVRAAYDRIARDDRHLEVRLCVSEPIPERMFGAWDMFHDPARSWLWTQAEISDGALDRATPQDFKDIFARLAAAAAETGATE